jgi:hypothetical protein
MMHTASDAFGADCIYHAIMALQLLADHRVPARLCAGHAAWRVGTAPGAVVAHHPQGEVIEDGRGVVFHAWITLADGSWIFDPTTYQLAAKMAMIDAADGLVTPVEIPEEWMGSVLMPAASTATWAQVRDGRSAGVCCYDANSALTRQILAHPDSVADPDLLPTLRMIFSHVSSRRALRVVGMRGAISLFA